MLVVLVVSERRACLDGMFVRPLHIDGNELYWDICRKLKVRQCDKISCFLSCFST